MATRNPSLNIVPSLKKKTAVTAEAEDELKGPRGDWWWTGVKPTACPGFDEKAGALRCVDWDCIELSCQHRYSSGRAHQSG